MQLDSGSGRTVMSKGVVDAYKMTDWMKSTDKTYTNASGVT